MLFVFSLEKKEINIAKVEFLKEEIEVKIESIKIELDKHGQILLNKLDQIEIEIEKLV